MNIEFIQVAYVLRIYIFDVEEYSSLWRVITLQNSVLKYIIYDYMWILNYMRSKCDKEETWSLVHLIEM